MKKNLRLLCLGLATAAFTVGFAQGENVTSKLKNADMEQGIKGWGIDGETNIWGKNTKTHNPGYTNRVGYHGMNGGVLENWKGSITSGLADNSISQSVQNLPSGTYVFGAYIAASRQDTILNKEEVVGVTLFANDASVPVATENPDKNQKATHTAKFNVAVKVTDGTLKVGLKAESTNANFLVWDNATLYYFGDMDEAAALDEMAKIDIAGVTAVADTIMTYQMQKDSLANLTTAYDAAKAVTSAADLWNASEELYWAIAFAHRSMSDYRSFNNAINSAKKVVALEWSEYVEEAVAQLTDLIAEAEAIYVAGEADRAVLNEKKAALNEVKAGVELDSAYFKQEELYYWAQDTEPGTEVGEYSQEMIDAVDVLSNDMLAATDAYEHGEITAVRASQLCDSLYTVAMNIINNPISYDSFPFTITASQEANADNRYTYTSKVYKFTYPVTNLRFTFKDTFCPNGSGKGNPVFVALGEFYLYDGNGDLIELTAQNFSTNAQESSEGPIANICDGEIGTYFHSDWHGNVKENHYIEIAIPDGLELTSFSFGWIDRGNRQNIPLVVEVSSLTTATADLMSAISSAEAMNAYAGTAPGFYNADLTDFYAALAAAKALVGSSASDDAVYAAIGALEEEQGKVDELGVVMPEAGKQYRIVSAAPFFEKQGIHKAWTAYSDTALVNQVWWETAHPDSVKQLFTFEVLPNDEGKNYYIIKNVATGLYVGTPVNEEGKNVNAAALFEVTDTVELQALGYGQFGLINSGMIHAGSHNSGNKSESAGAYGGIAGVFSSMVKWTTGAYNASAWYIRELNALPYAAKNISDLNFKSETINLYEGVNTLTLTADKDCAFADLVVYGLLGEEIRTSVTNNGAVATVVLDTAMIESFSFAFANAEGVAEVTVNGAISKLSLLQTAYDEAVAVNPTEGEEVMQYRDLVAYKAALDAAEALLLNGGSNEAIEAAIAALEAAVEGLVPNMPDPDKTYFIVSAVEAFETNHGVKMMMYANAEGTPRWMYENPYNTNRMWKFEAGPEATEEKPAMYYVKNVALGKYLGSDPSALAETPSPYAITSLGSGQVALDMDNQGNNSGRIHANGHGGGAGKGSNIVFWGSGVGTASAWYIFESQAYLTDIDFTQFDVEGNEYVAPAKKGIFDLYGRRIEAPATTGIYIVDGKKRVIKK